MSLGGKAAKRMGKRVSIWMILFFAVLAAGVGFGIVRDVASTEQAVLDASVVKNAPDGPGYRWPTTPPSIKAQLASNDIVDVATRGGTQPDIGSTVQIRQMLTPWGQVWYKLKD